MNKPKYQINNIGDRIEELDFAICDVCYCSYVEEYMIYEENTGAIICSDCVDRGYFSDDEDE
jgi:hypothetical protein